MTNSERKIANLKTMVLTYQYNENGMKTGVDVDWDELFDYLKELEERMVWQEVRP